MPDRMQQQLRAATVALAPVVLLAGFAYHPYVHDLLDESQTAAAASADPARWGAAHLVIGFGLALALLLFFALRTHLREIREDRWSFVSVPLAAVGLTSFAMIVGVDGIGGQGAAEAGAAERFFEVVAGPARPLQLAAVLLTALAILAMGIAVARSGLLRGPLAAVALVAAVVAAGALFVPRGWATYTGTAALFFVAWPIAYRMWPRRG